MGFDTIEITPIYIDTCLNSQFFSSHLVDEKNWEKLTSANLELDN